MDGSKYWGKTIRPEATLDLIHSDPDSKSYNNNYHLLKYVLLHPILILASTKSLQHYKPRIKIRMIRFFKPISKWTLTILTLIGFFSFQLGAAEKLRDLNKVAGGPKLEQLKYIGLPTPTTKQIAKFEALKSTPACKQGISTSTIKVLGRNLYHLFRQADSLLNLKRAAKKVCNHGNLAYWKKYPNRSDIGACIMSANEKKSLAIPTRIRRNKPVGQTAAAIKLCKEFITYHYKDKFMPYAQAIINKKIKVIKNAKLRERQLIAKQEHQKSNEQKAIIEGEERSTLIAKIIPSKKDRLIWSFNHYRDFAVHDAFIEPNWEIFAAVHSRERELFDFDGHEINKFSPPSKGEFEKSSDYNSRVDSLRQKFTQNAMKKTADLSDDRDRVMSGLIRDAIGAPVVINLIYDADKEEFSFTIQAARKKFSLKASLPMPLSKAKAFKSDKSRLLPNVVFSTAGKKVTVEAIFLQRNGETYFANIEGSKIVASKYGVDAIAEMKANSHARFAANFHKNAEAEEMEKQANPYRAEFTCSSFNNYIPVAHCLSDDGYIQFNLTGSQSQVKSRELGGNARFSRNIPKTFALASLNGYKNKHFTLNLKITNRDTGDEVYSGNAKGSFAKILVEN